MYTMLPVKYLNLHLKTISNLQNVNQVGSAMSKLLWSSNEMKYL